MFGLEKIFFSGLETPKPSPLTVENYLRVLAQYGVDVISIRDRDDLAWYIATEVVGELGFVDCVIYYLDEARENLVQTAAIGEKSPERREILNPMIIPLGQGITGSVAKTHTPEIVRDVRKDKRYVTDLNVSGSEICVPLIHEGRLFGVIDSEHPQSDFFGPTHMDMLLNVATLMSARLSSIDTEQALLRQQFILDRINDVVAITGPGGEILDVNTAAESIYGYRREELVGKNIVDLVAIREGWDEQRAAALKELAETGTWSGRVDIRRKDGTTRVHDVASVPFLDEDGTLKNIINVARDVTEVEEANEALASQQRSLNELGVELHAAIEATKLAQKTQGIFLANASHELRTPLNAIVGFSRMLAVPELGRYSLEKVQEYAGYINTAGEHLARLVDDLLDISKLEAGGGAPQPENLYLATQFNSCLVLVSPRLEAREIRLEVRVPDEFPAVYFDKAHLKQIVINLLDNAIKYSPPGSRVELLARTRSESEAEIVVKDQGKGIAPERMKTLFEPFAGEPWSVAEGVRSTGLGLSIVQKMAEMNGAYVEVESEVGVGSEFRLVLPFAAAGDEPELPLVSDNGE